MAWQYNREQGVKSCGYWLKMKNPAFPFEKTGFLESGAGNEIRTRDPNLGKVVLYQLSYSRTDDRLVPTTEGYSTDTTGAVNHFYQVFSRRNCVVALGESFNFGISVQ